MSEQKPAQQEFEFRAEMKQLLNLIVHSLYTNPEIFLRELISNSSDALNKIRFKNLTEKDINSPEAELRIDIETDKETGAFSITDSGIGMTEDDLVSRLGTIASSGTLDFVKQMQDENKTVDADMIGKFGVGFYSVYMVTDFIEVETLHAEKGSKAYNWASQGEDKFTIEETGRVERGTKISFTLKDEYKELADTATIQRIIKKYSNFVDFPVYVNGDKINTVQAIWQKRKDEVTEDELNDFYRFVSGDYQNPMGHLHVSIEGSVNYKSLVFIPPTAPPQFFKDSFEKSLQLYSSRVFIQDDCQELLPEYLRFLKGVVDTEDLPLNVSREVTQNSPVLAKIQKTLVSKILGYLEELAENDNEKYLAFFKNFGTLLKTGINTDFANKDKIVDLLRYETSLTETGKYTSLKDYVAKMKDDQKEIYYISGEHRDLIERSPNLEYFKKNEIEVIYLIDPVDVFTFPYITEYQGKTLKSVEKADLDIKDEGKEENLKEEERKSLTEFIKEFLGDKVEDVIESKRLVDSAATLVVGNSGLDPQMEKMMAAMDKSYAGGKRILEVNMNHDLIKNLFTIYNSDKDSQLLKDSVSQLFEGCLLMEGILSKPSDYVRRMTEILVTATK
jgi:molecular chaperone HtpG